MHGKGLTVNDISEAVIVKYLAAVIFNANTAKYLSKTNTLGANQGGI